MRVQEIHSQCAGHAATAWVCLLSQDAAGCCPRPWKRSWRPLPPRTITLAAAMLYQNKARELEAEAVEYETAVSKIAPYQDSKGFHVAHYGWPRKKSGMMRSRCRSCMPHISPRPRPCAESSRLNN